LNTLHGAEERRLKGVAGTKRSAEATTGAMNINLSIERIQNGA
jgi:hypothetical protein